MHYCGILVIVSILACGCGATRFEPVTYRAEPTPRDAKICVETPDDGVYDSHVYVGSGQIVAERIRRALVSYGFEADIDCESQFRVKANLKHWEDRATGWSGLRDEVEVELGLYGPGSDGPARAVTYKAIPNWFAASVVDGGWRKPQALLTDEFDQAVGALVQ